MNQGWIGVLLGISLASHSLLLGATLIQFLRPELEWWPPPGRMSWQFRLTWALFVLSVIATIGLGLLDWNGLGWPASIRFPVGGVLIGGGLALAFYGIHTLSAHQTLGLEGDLTTGGPYRFTRNPQYLGDFLATSGWMVLTASGFVMLAALPALAWYLLLPRIEEPWLARRFGNAYHRYAARVARFL